MRSPVRSLFATVAISTAMLAATALPASAAAPNTNACKSGGYVNYVDPATGKAFANQGRCVSTVAKGGVLVPVVPPVSVTRWSLFPSMDRFAERCWVTAEVQGVFGVEYPYSWVADDQVIFSGTMLSGRTDGTEGLGSPEVVWGKALVLVIGDEEFTAPAIVPGCSL